MIIAGIDEAGRGALAGPVVAAACVIQSSLIPRKTPFISWSPVRNKRQQGFCLIADSKKLTPEQRESSLAWIKQNCIFGVGMSSAEDIDGIGILGATEKAMQEAVKALAMIAQPTYLLVDGRDKFWFDYSHTSIIRGDESESFIAAASIIAKVTRDHLMIEASKDFPEYAFYQHKGYGTEAHYQCLKQHGMCSLHRRSFLKNTDLVAQALSDESLPSHIQSPTPKMRSGIVSN